MFLRKNFNSHLLWHYLHVFYLLDNVGQGPDVVILLQLYIVWMVLKKYINHEKNKGTVHKKQCCGSAFKKSSWIRIRIQEVKSLGNVQVHEVNTELEVGWLQKISFSQFHEILISCLAKFSLNFAKFRETRNQKLGEIFSISRNTKSKLFHYFFHFAWKGMIFY